MPIDFFVHPEHARLTGYPKQDMHEKYSDHLKRVLAESRLPVLVNGLEEGEFNRLFPQERILESTSFYVIDYPFDHGEIAPCDWEKFISIIGQEREFRVHGCYLGECTEGFAVQLFAWLKRGEHWHNWKGRGLSDEDKQAYKKQKRLRKQHEKQGDFRDCGIKFGVVLSAPHPKPIKKSSFIRIPLLTRRPYGNITWQLIDENTRIY